MTEPTATPACRTIELHLTGYPVTDYRWGAGSLRPERVVIIHLDDRHVAHLFGTWINEDGDQTSDPVDQFYRHDDTLPDWLRVLADRHQPEAKKPLLPKRTFDPWPRIPVDTRPDSDFHHLQRIARRAAAAWSLGPDGPFKKAQPLADTVDGSLRHALLHLLELGLIDIDVDRMNAAPGWPFDRERTRP